MKLCFLFLLRLCAGSFNMTFTVLSFKRKGFESVVVMWCRKGPKCRVFEAEVTNQKKKQNKQNQPLYLWVMKFIKIKISCRI